VEADVRDVCIAPSAADANNGSFLQYSCVHFPSRRSEILALKCHLIVFE